MVETYLVIIDTNIIFFQDKGYVVDPAFDEFLENQSDTSKLVLYIPEVVEGEVLYQQTTSALKTLERADNSLKTLREVTEKKYTHKATKDRVKNDIKQRFNKWKKAKKATEIETPISNICWQPLVNQSIWREPPFSPATKKDNSEKGFRDAIILETVVDFSNEKNTQQIVFLCNDTLLRETAEKRLENITNFSAYSSLKEFESYLRLRNEEIELKLVKGITNKARKKFFTYNDNNSLAYKEKLSKRIREEYKDELDSPEEVLKGDPSRDEDTISEIDAVPTGKGKFMVRGKPEFIKRENTNTFFWRSVVKYIRPYKFLIGEEFEYSDYSYEVVFHINWKVNVSINNIFTKMEIIDIALDDMDLFDIE